jgi:hypothetical protein
MTIQLSSLSWTANGRAVPDPANRFRAAAAGFVVAGLSPMLSHSVVHTVPHAPRREISQGVGGACLPGEQRQRAEVLASSIAPKPRSFNVSREFRTPLTLMLGPAEDAPADADAPRWRNVNGDTGAPQRAPARSS